MIDDQSSKFKKITKISESDYAKEELESGDSKNGIVETIKKFSSKSLIHC